MEINLEKYFNYGILTAIIVFLTILISYYTKYWIEFRRVCKQLGIEWPLPPQRELMKEINEDFRAIKKVYISPFKTFKLIFFPPTKNPILMKPIRGIRRCWLAFILFPIFLGFVSIVIAVLITNL